MSPQAFSQPILRYFRDFSQLLDKIEVTANGSKIEFTNGIDEVLKQIADIRSRSGKLMFVGNGGSAAIASHEALDFWRTCGVPAIAFNDPIQLTCLGNDFGYEQVFSKPIDVFAQPGDLLLAISSSGCSRNILNAVEAARLKHCVIMTFSGFKPDNPLRSLGDLNFYVPSLSYGHVELAHLAIIHAVADIWSGK